MEQQQPQLELPLPDRETFERVWRRVMPDQSRSPVAVDGPEAHGTEAAEGEAEPRPAVQRQRDEVLLTELMEMAWSGMSSAQALVRRMGNRGRQLSELPGDHQRAVRQLSAFYFILTGRPSPVRGGAASQETRPLPQALRAQYRWEREWAEACLRGSRRAEDGEICALLEELAQDGLLHSRTIRGVLERMEHSRLD